MLLLVGGLYLQPCNLSFSPLKTTELAKHSELILVLDSSCCVRTPPVLPHKPPSCCCRGSLSLSFHTISCFLSSGLFYDFLKCNIDHNAMKAHYCENKLCLLSLTADSPRRVDPDDADVAEKNTGYGEVTFSLRLN